MDDNDYESFFFQLSRIPRWISERPKASFAAEVCQLLMAVPQKGKGKKEHGFFGF